MHSNHDILTTDPVTFPPIPIATGMLWTKEDGSTVPVKGITVVVHTDDGDEVRVPLRRDYGAWWS